MTYAPSLLIGLGGTGAEVLLRVKKQLQARGLEDKGLHRFLFIDTDYDTFSPGRRLPDIEARERCLVGADKVDTFLAEPDLFTALLDRFPEERLKYSNIEKLSQGVGTGQIRSLGAFAVALEAGRVREKLIRAHNDLTGPKPMVKAKAGSTKIKIGNRVHIYLVGSLAGGMGSGSFLDVGLLSKRACQTSNPNLVGMFALPGAFDDEVNGAEQKVNIRANAYGALKELQFCLDAGREKRQDIGTIEFNYDTVPGPNLELPPHDQLFDLCFLIGHQNSRGELSEIEELYNLMARSLLNDVGFSFGASVESFESQISVLDAVPRCQETKFGRRFSTISTSVLSYPATRVAEYCTYRTAESVVRDHLIGGPPAEETLRTRLSDFLDQHDLDNRGEANQLLESLLRVEDPDSLDPAPESGEPLSRNRFDLSSNYGEDLSVEKFALQIQDEWRRFSSTTLPEIEALVDQNRQYRIGEEDRPLRAAVEELALSTAAEHGARAAREILEMLEEVVQQMRTELREENDSWRERKAWLTQEFMDNMDELAEVGAFKAFFTSEDEELKTHLIELYGELVEGELREAARPAARWVLDTLIAETQHVASRWKNLLAKLTRLRSTLRKEANKRETHAPEMGFTVVRDITRPGHERRYYLENSLSSEEAFAVVLDTYDDASDSQAELFRDAQDQGTLQFGEDALIEPLYDKIEGPILDTNVVEFALNHPEEVGEDEGEDALKRKLNVQSDLCRPFWPAGSGKTQEFLELKGIIAPEDHFKNDGTPVYSPVIDEWKDTHGYSGIPSTTKREIILSRKAFGARGFYLSGIFEWKTQYEKRQEVSEGKYMMETHVQLRDIPDLFPDAG